MAFVHNTPNVWFSYSKVEKHRVKSFNTKSLLPMQPDLHLKILCSAHSLQLRFFMFLGTNGDYFHCTALTNLTECLLCGTNLIF